MLRALQFAWANDIITVIASGNDGDRGLKLAHSTPQNLGTVDNALITVGGVIADGSVSTITRLPTDDGGSMTVYGISDDVWVANYRNDGLEALTGTSFAAPAVAGLAAYYAGLPSIADEFPAGNIAQTMKNYIAGNAVIRNSNPSQNLPAEYQQYFPAGSVRVAYNQAPDGLCADQPVAPSPPLGFEKRDAANVERDIVAERQATVDAGGDFDVVVSGTIVDSSALPSVCALSSTSSTSSPTSTPTSSPITTTSVPPSPSSTPTTSDVASTTTTPSLTLSISSTSTTLTSTTAVTTSFIDCTTQNADPDSGITSGFCLCSGSTYSISLDTLVTPAVSCAYTALGTATASVTISTTVSTIASACEICTYVGDSAQCGPLSGCTLTSTSTSSSVYPTNTAEDDGSAYCFTSANGPYVSFTQGDAKNVVAAFCNNNYVLKPGNTNGFVEAYSAGDYVVYASAAWAQDQDGCGAEVDLYFDADSKACLDGWSTDYYCENEHESVDSSYGGAYVLLSPTGGCVLVQLYAESTPSKSRRGMPGHRAWSGFGPAFNLTTPSWNTTSWPNLHRPAATPPGIAEPLSMWGATRLGSAGSLSLWTEADLDILYGL